MRDKMFHIKGRVIDRKTQRGISGLRIEAWDKDLIFDDLVGSAVTGERGAFEITFDRSYFKEPLADRQPDLFFKVFHQDQLVHSTEDSVLWNVDEGDTSIEIEVEDPTTGQEPTPKTFTVRGRIVQADGSPVEGIAVKAFDQDVGGERLLGETTTDQGGRYRLQYESAQLSRAGKAAADLIVRAFDAKGNEIATSPLILGALTNQIVELVVGNEPYRGPSEYVRLRTTLQPLLEDREVATLTEQDITYLAAKTELDPIHIAYLVKGARLEKKTGIAAEAYYALFRQQLPTSLPALIAQDPAVQRRALESAIRNNLVGASLKASLDDVMEQLREQIVEHAFRKPELPDRSSLSDLLSTAGLSEAKQRTFLRSYLQHDGEIENFWQGLRDDPDFGSPETVEALQFTLQLGALTLNHLPLVKVLQQQRQAGDLQSLPDLARLERADWEALIRQEVDGSTVGVPPTIPGADDEEKVVNYAQTMTRIIEDAFPTAVLAHRIQGEDFPYAESVSAFLDANPDFDFRTRQIDKHLAEHEHALAGIQDAEEVTEQLRVVQRLFHTAPRYEKYDAIQPLMADGITSALAIRRMGEANFKRRYANPRLGPARAAEVYANASQRVAMVENLYGLYAIDMAVGFYVTRDRPESVEGIPNWQTLFGSLDLCECEHCRSVYSPAAYLVDILHFLKQRQTGDRTVLDVLFDRRPDIGETELTCENTNTVLPYIDLINEVLENAVAGTDEAHQTEGQSAELRVAPQHLNRAAYGVLADAVYPWTLPFDLWTEEARVHLIHLGVPRHQLMDLLREEGEEPEPLDIAGEHLHLARWEREIITGTATAPGGPRAFWGMSEYNWDSHLREVATFLRQSGLGYEELQALLHVHYINPSGELRIDCPPTCDLDAARIEGLSDAAFRAALGRIHRFVRLQRKLNWSFRELDAALRALPPQRLTGDFLIQLSHVKHLQEQLKVPLIPMLSWWAPIDTVCYDDAPSLYEKLFLDKTVIKEDDLLFEVFQLNDAREELINPDESMAEHPTTDLVPALVAALGISADDLALLIEAELPEDRLLNLANLSALYRAVSLAKAVRLSISDFLILRALSDINPFDVSDVQAALRFVEAARLVRASGFSFAELDHLLRHCYKPNAVVAPGEEEISLFLGELRIGLQRIAQENRFVTDPTGEQSTQALAVLLPETEAQRALALLDGTSTEDEADQRAFVDDFFAVFLEDTAGAKETLLGPGALTGEDRFNYILPPLLTYLGQSTLIKQKLADVLGLDMEASELLLSQLVPSREDATQRAIADFRAPTFIESSEDPLTVASFDIQFNQFRLLDKICTVVTKFNIPSEELTWLFQQGPGLGWLDLNALPLHRESGDGTAEFATWARMAEMARLRNELPPGEPSLFELLRMLHDDATEDAFREALNARTSWRLEDLEFLMGARGFDLTFPNDYQNEQALVQLVRLKSCFDLINRLGMSAEQIWGWNTQEVTFEQARSIKQAVKAKYQEEQWLAVAAPLRDELREQQRMALVSHLVQDLADQGIHSANDLFGHFLIDVEMSACMMTSRVKQTISSVQLFVQRCLMNLEPEVILTPEDAEEWSWMKNYRVWEANRKVFLYPENWIEPELRDDKSPFFKDLENALLQNDVTRDTAEGAFLGYLEELDQVARLEISGMYQDEEAGVLHVFAHTHSTPPVYYYRRWIGQSYWTPWEKVDVDVDVDPDTGQAHLIPVGWNRRLYLFWPVFMEKAIETDQSDSDDNGPENPRRYYEIKMAWTEYKNGRWLAKRISDVALKTRETEDLEERALYRFWARAKEDAVCVYPEIRNESGQIIQGASALSLVDFVFSKRGGWAKRDSGTVVDLRPISGTASQYMKFVETGGEDILDLVTSGETMTVWCSADSYDWAYITSCNENSVKVLQRTPGTFKITLPHQYRPFFSQAPLFYEDDARTFLIVPTYGFFELGVVVGWHQPDHTRLEAVGFARDLYRSVLGVGLSSPAAERVTFAGRSRISVATGGRDITITPRNEAPEMRMPAPAEPAGTMLLGGDNSAWFYMLTETLMDRVLREDDSDLALPNLWTIKKYRFSNFFHPYVDLLIGQLNRHGIDGLLSPKPGGEVPEALPRQLIEYEYFDDEEHGYAPTDVVDDFHNYPLDSFDFDPGGAYSLYNWELFFHAPFLIANRLSNNQRFQEAQKWYHYIFDPTDVSPDAVPARFWKIKPFYECAKGDPAKPIQELMVLLGYSGTEKEKRELADSLNRQVESWRANPFNPHLIARLRWMAYQKAIVMKYLDNLIAWGDHLFRQDTIESINEATQLYVLAAQILGPRPESVPGPEGTPKIGGVEIKAFNDLEPHLDEFSNALVEIETALPPTTGANGVDEAATSLVIGPTLFFCIPRNDKLLSYWDTVADRLFKIRHCMTIQGVVRQLPLFQPPIEPGLLVRAAAAGVDISSALNDLYAPLPHYRFQIMLQKALELCADVKALGAALMAALEKRDAEELALLRSSHEVQILVAMRQVKEQQEAEAKEAADALEKAKEMTEARRDYYQCREYMNAQEKLHLEKLQSAHRRQSIGQLLELAASALAVLPEFDVGVSGISSPVVKARWGGSNLLGAFRAASQAMSILASMDNHDATMASIKGGFDRRADDWAFQADQAVAEIEQITKQIAAADIREAIANLELENHELQTENARGVEAYMRDKFTNQELYHWMVSQISTIYFQSYQMAYDLAKRAEKAYRHEIGDPEASHIQFGYWDSLKKGLLAGERLHYDLKRMEIAYLDQNKREYEITKHVSLATLDPVALIMLKETGECFVNLPEAIFDLDYPGHYRRRIRSVSLTIPCVTGPYTSVNCTLTLLGNRVRKDTTGESYPYAGVEDPRFQHNLGAIQSIATSSAQNDSGLFELNFRDERYLPFEGAGVISRWRIELPNEFRQFDYDTITDIIFHIRYTARDGGSALKEAATDALQEAINAMALGDERTGLIRLFSARQEFPNEWYRFFRLVEDEGVHKHRLTLDLSSERFPYLFRNKDKQINNVTLLVKLREGIAYDGSPFRLYVTPAGGVATSKELEIDPQLERLPQATWDTSGAEPGEWLLEAFATDISSIPEALRVPQEIDGETHYRLNPDAIEDVGILCYYSVET